MNEIQKAFRSNYFKHETKRNVLLRFILVIFIVLSYFIYISFEYGIQNGLLVTLLSWSFFVFCTPIADAGFLFDFPLRIVTKIRMFFAEMCVWSFAALLNIYSIVFKPEIYQKTLLLELFHKILTNPYPFWSIIIVCCIGTFMSVYFGDELIDKVKHHEREKYQSHNKKHKIVVIVFIVLAIILYYILLNNFGFTIY